MHHHHPFTLSGHTFRMISVQGTGDDGFTMGSPENEPARPTRAAAPGRA